MSPRELLTARRAGAADDCQLQDDQLVRLATWDEERERGIVHRADYDAWMGGLLRRFDVWNARAGQRYRQLSFDEQVANTAAVSRAYPDGVHRADGAEPQ